MEQFVGTPFRQHSDIDVTFFRDEQMAAQHWLDGWQLYAAAPPGTLRRWMPGEYLRAGIHDIWGHRTESSAWELQLMLAETDGAQWFSRRDARIRGQREDFFTTYGAVSCIRIDIQLMYKAKAPRPKDEQDFRACLPHMSTDERQRLVEHLEILHPDGHDWLNALRA